MTPIPEKQPKEQRCSSSFNLRAVASPERNKASTSSSSTLPSESHRRPSTPRKKPSGEAPVPPLESKCETNKLTSSAPFVGVWTADNNRQALPRYGGKVNPNRDDTHAPRLRRSSSFSHPMSVMKRKDDSFLTQIEDAKKQKISRDVVTLPQEEQSNGIFKYSVVDKQGFAMDSGAESDDTPVPRGSKRSSSLPPRYSNGAWTDDEMPNSSSGRLDSGRVRQRRALVQSSGDETVVLPIRLNLTLPRRKTLFDVNKMPKPLCVPGDYVLSKCHDQVMYISRLVEGTTPIHYACINLMGESLLASQDDLKLFITVDGSQPAHLALPIIDRTQELVLPTKGMRVNYSEGQEAPQEVTVSGLMRNTVPNRYVVKLEQTAGIRSKICLREELQILIPTGSTFFQCGICLEIYDNKDASKLIDKCNGCQCTLCKLQHPRIHGGRKQPLWKMSCQ